MMIIYDSFTLLEKSQNVLKITFHPVSITKKKGGKMLASFNPSMLAS